MKYLCLIYDEEKKFGAMSKSEIDGIMAEYGAFTEGIKKSGHYVGGEALKPVHTATTVRVRSGKMSTTDGPFAETKEQLLGFYGIDCATLDEAIETAGQMWREESGMFEVRPIRYFAPGSDAA